MLLSVERVPEQDSLTPQVVESGGRESEYLDNTTPDSALVVEHPVKTEELRPPIHYNRLELCARRTTFPLARSGVV